LPKERRTNRIGDKNAMAVPTCSDTRFAAAGPAAMPHLDIQPGSMPARMPHGIPMPMPDPVHKLYPSGLLRSEVNAATDGGSVTAQTEELTRQPFANL
jgi:hypothetical protein